MVEEPPPGRPAVAPVPTTMAIVPDDDERSAAYRRVIEAVGRKILEHGERVARSAGVRDIDTRIDEGDPAHARLDGARREDADLIAVGSRGLSDISDLPLGSVSHKVIQLAECTCITVK
jgi:nucleotide-binding universal stress UspA family protein